MAYVNSMGLNSLENFLERILNIAADSTAPKSRNIPSRLPLEELDPFISTMNITPLTERSIEAHCNIEGVSLKE